VFYFNFVVMDSKTLRYAEVKVLVGLCVVVVQAVCCTVGVWWVILY